MASMFFRLRGFAGWAGGAASAVALPAILKRRVSPLGQQALQAAWGLSDVKLARYVMASRHGEFGRTLSLMKAAHAEEETSPADFTLSVHHALIGLLSIAAENQGGGIAVAAGAESFCFGLMEAVACAHETPGIPVLYMYYDEPLPGEFAVFNEPYAAPIAMAMAIEACAAHEGFGFEMEPGGGGMITDPALQFMNFVNGSDAALNISGIERHWRWVRHVAA